MSKKKLDKSSPKNDGKIIIKVEVDRFYLSKLNKRAKKSVEDGLRVPGYSVEDLCGSILDHAGKWDLYF